MKKVFTIAFAAILAGACSGGVKAPGAKGPEPAAEILPAVKVVTASKQLVEDKAVYSSTVLADVTNNIAPQTGGRIQKINVEVGDFVSAGQILAEMDRVQLEQAKLRLANEKTELDRLRSLYEKGGLSQSDYDAVVLSCKVSQATYDNLLENTVLRSPVSGVVTARNYDRGDMYAMAQPIFTVQKITPVKLLIGVSESDYTRVKKGDAVSLTADALPGRVFEGKVNRIYPTVDAATHTFNVEVTVPNADKALRPGMFVRSTLVFSAASKVVLPDAAVVKMQGSGQRYVYVVDENSVATERVVKPGNYENGTYAILEGVSEGEKIVVKGQNGLRSGDKVQIVE